MHTPTYFALMAIATVYGVVNLFLLWDSNWLLFSAGVAVIFISLVGAYLQRIGGETFEWTWMLWYLAPIGLIAVGQVAGLDEIRNSQLSRLNIPAIPSVIPGSSGDYARAAGSHMVSMVLPLVARLIAGGVGIYLRRKE